MMVKTLRVQILRIDRKHLTIFIVQGFRYFLISLKDHKYRMIHNLMYIEQVRVENTETN